MKKIILIFILVACFKSAMATQTPLERFIEQEVANIVLYMEEEDNSVVSISKWYLDTFRISIEAPLGVSVPFLAKFEVKPFVEFHWGRNHPAGFVPYRP